MKKNNLKINSLREIIKYAVIILSLVIITVLLLEMPRQYYAWDEESMKNKVTVKTYATVNIVKEDMTLNQKIYALSDDDTIVTAGKRTFTIDEKQEMRQNIADEIDDNMITAMQFGWDSNLYNALYADNAWRDWTSFQLIKIIDSNIYCFDVGIMGFQTDINLYGWLMFDMETYKILYMSAYADAAYEEMEKYGYIYNDEVGGYLESDSVEKNIEIAEENYVNALGRYYGIDLSAENCGAMIAFSYLCISPLTVEDLSGKTMTTIRESLDEQFYGVVY